MKEEKTQNIFKHRTVILLSFCFCYFSPRSLLIRHWTYFRQPAEDGIIAYLLVQFNPGEVASTVGILESKEPHLPESNGFDSLVEQLFACGRLLDGELQFGIHGRHPYVHLGREESRNQINHSLCNVPFILFLKLFTINNNFFLQRINPVKNVRFFFVKI